MEGEVCKVCLEPADGVFFGAPVCLPCKSFYIRSTKNGWMSLACGGGGDCEVVGKLGRTLCQACRFARCLAAGMHRKERPEEVIPADGQTACAVCGDLANGIHFGVHSCEGCKKFFRRCLKEDKSYLCKSNGRCAITPRTRNSCRQCRYQCCLGAAMRLGRPKKLARAAFDTYRPSNRSILKGPADVPTPETNGTSTVTFGLSVGCPWAAHTEAQRDCAKNHTTNSDTLGATSSFRPQDSIKILNTSEAGTSATQISYPKLAPQTQDIDHTPLAPESASASPSPENIPAQCTGTIPARSTENIPAQSTVNIPTRQFFKSGRALHNQGNIFSFKISTDAAGCQFSENESLVFAEIAEAFSSLRYSADQPSLTLLCSHRPPRSCAEGGVSIKGLSFQFAENDPALHVPESTPTLASRGNGDDVLCAETTPRPCFLTSSFPPRSQVLHSNSLHSTENDEASQTAGRLNAFQVPDVMAVPRSQENIQMSPNEVRLFTPGQSHTSVQHSDKPCFNEVVVLERANRISLSDEFLEALGVS